MYVLARTGGGADLSTREIAIKKKIPNPKNATSNNNFNTHDNRPNPL